MGQCASHPSNNWHQYQQPETRTLVGERRGTCACAHQRACAHLCAHVSKQQAGESRIDGALLTGSLDRLNQPLLGCSPRCPAGHSPGSSTPEPQSRLCATPRPSLPQGPGAGRLSGQGPLHLPGPGRQQQHRLQVPLAALLWAPAPGTHLCCQLPCQHRAPAGPPCPPFREPTTQVSQMQRNI